MIPAAKVLGEAALYRERSMRERVLLRLRWYDWASLSQLVETMDAEDDANAQTLIARELGLLVKRGLVERKGTPMHYRYRLVVAGGGR